MTRLYSCRAGTSWVLVEAATADLARRSAAERLGYERRPELWDRITVRHATAADVERYGALADAHRSKPATDKPKRKRTAERLRERFPGSVEMFPEDAA